MKVAAMAVAGGAVADCVWPAPKKWLTARVSAVLAASATAHNDLISTARQVKGTAHVSRTWQQHEVSARHSVDKQLASARAAVQHAQAAVAIGTHRVRVRVCMGDACASMHFVVPG